MGEIASPGAIMSVADMTVLNYDVIYDMCEPQVKEINPLLGSSNGHGKKNGFKTTTF